MDEGGEARGEREGVWDEERVVRYEGGEVRYEG